MKKINLTSKRGFTLIELLVVIGILAVLAAIAIPSVAGLIDRANVSADKTNSNEMTNSIERFTSEYEVYCQDIAAGKIKNVANLDGAQSRVYNVTKATTRGEIEQLESEEGFNGRAIDGDTNYPTNVETARAVVQTYEKTSSSTFEPKQSDAHYYYSPDCGVVIAQDTEKADVLSLNALVPSGLDASGQKLNANTVWIDLTDGIDAQKTPANCGIEGHYEGDSRGKHGVATNCSSGHQYTCECDGWTVPAGGKYYIGVYTRDLGDYTGATKIYNAGEKLPCGHIPKKGNIYVDKDYEYRYNDAYYFSTWSSHAKPEEWGVRVLDDSKTSYGALLESISNKPVVTLYATFHGCKSLITAPKMPNTVKNIDSAFGGCSSLKTAPVISNNAVTMNSTFMDCTSLTVPPVIPNSVTDMTGAFERCINITKAPILPPNLKRLYNTFAGCTSLTVAPVIPNTVTDFNGTFSNCTSLKNAPRVPSSVEDMSYAFKNCTSLTGAIEIHTNSLSSKYEYNFCFSDVDFAKQNIILSGETTMLDEIGSTGKNYCSECNGTCKGNH